MGSTGTGSRLVFVSQQFIGAKDIRIGSLNFHISLEMWFPDKNICLRKSFSLTAALHGNATLNLTGSNLVLKKDTLLQVQFMLAK